RVLCRSPIRAHPSPSESWRDTDVHLSIFVTFRIRTDSDGYPLGCDWSAKEIISERHHFRNLTFPVSFPICYYSVKRVDQPDISVRARPVSDRVVPEPDSYSNILSESNQT